MREYVIVIINNLFGALESQGAADDALIDLSNITEPDGFGLDYNRETVNCGAARASASLKAARNHKSSKASGVSQNNTNTRQMMMYSSDLVDVYGSF